MTVKYELITSDPDIKNEGNVFEKGRILIGRSESCDFIVFHDALSSVHAVLEILDDKAIIFDMNSTNGTYVGEEKIISKEIAIDTRFRLADIEFEFKRHQSSTIKLPSIAPKLSESSPQLNAVAADPYSLAPEYIFEDKDELYPIFQYESIKRAFEVIILFKEKVFSIDYLPEGNFTYFLSGKTDSKYELEFPYLLKNQKVKFLKIYKGSCEVQNIPGFNIIYLGDKKQNLTEAKKSYELHENDLVKIFNDHIQIIVRNVVAPPQIVAAPMFKRDPEFRKALLFSLFAAILLSIGTNLIGPSSSGRAEHRAHLRLAAILNRSQK